MTKLMTGLAALLLLAMGGAASAQQASRIRGQIEKIENGAMEVKARDGTMMSIKVSDDARVSALVKATLADLKDDTFIGVAGTPRPDGTIEAYSIHIFLPAQRGVVPDRFGPWDGQPDATMTNGYVVGGTVGASDAQTLTVKYKEGEKKIVITPKTVIAAVAPGNKDELKAGTQIIIMQSDKAADGAVTAKNLYIGRGVAPAM